MAAEQSVVFATSVGWVCAAWRDGLLREMAFAHSSPDAAVRSMRFGSVSPVAPHGSLCRFRDRLQNFLRHPDDDFLDIELDLADYTRFQRSIVQKCREIRIGETRTYAELSQLAGHPKAARATGTVMATNRFPLLVPCHRVVGTGGSLGGYSAPNGLILKRQLLEMESRVQRFEVRG